MIRGSPSLGYVVATHGRVPDQGPTVITYYYPLIDADVAVARKTLYETTWKEWVEIIVDDLARACLFLTLSVDPSVDWLSTTTISKASVEEACSSEARHRPRSSPEL